jgi:DNA-binding NtrC family response regulator
VHTATDHYRVGAATRRGVHAEVLYVACHGNELVRLPSRHVLRDVDVVCFGRGAHGCERDGRRLVLRVDDPLMSRDHGQLVAHGEDWQLDDPRSKNGVLAGGRVTRSCIVEPDRVFALGHTVMFLAREVADERPVDLDGADLRAPLPGLATFDLELEQGLCRMARLARTELPILLFGETGTGKEVTAAALHALSLRPGPCVAVNCGGLTPTLVESELFGHCKGAFSGAVGDRLGYVRSADRGTLFLDEVGELPRTAQAALLRVLQEREVVPVGDSLPVPVDFRVICATHRDLAALVAAGTFREDLYARIVGATITLPPLRARRGDLGLLIPTLLRRQGPARVTLSPQAAIALFEYDWPRNIRQLERALAYMTAVADQGPVAVEHLPRELQGGPAPRPAAVELRSPLTSEQVARKQRLELELQQCGGNVAEVARRVHKDRTQIYRWMRELGISLERGGSS